jgi:hypothetical protein
LSKEYSNLRDPKPGIYDRELALDYAKLYLNTRNETYPILGRDIQILGKTISVGADCTNYVAQCLIAGGVLPEKWQPDPFPSPGGVDITIIPGFHWDATLPPEYRVADRFVTYLQDKHLAVKVNDFSKLQPGDVISFQENKDPRADHVALFVGYKVDKQGNTILKNGKPIPMAANHSSDGIREVPINLVKDLLHVIPPSEQVSKR